MRIRVYAASFCSFENIDRDGYMVLPDGAVLDDVYKRLQVPWLYRRIVFATVNYKKVSLKTRLQDGDVVSFLSALGGG
jgi:molybdopterin converting factor small subunit